MFVFSITIPVVFMATVMPCTSNPHASLVPIPMLPQDLYNVPGIERFYHLWERVLEHDDAGNAPFIRVNSDPQVLLVPNNFRMMNMIPQDLPNPLRDSRPQFAPFRKRFLFDHMVLDALPDQIYTPEGALLKTFSNRDILIRQHPTDGLVANGVKIQHVASLESGTKVFKIDGTLFDFNAGLEEINDSVKSFFRFTEIDEPLGPPLVLENPNNFEPQPPAPPTREELIDFTRSGVSPPAPPTHEELLALNRPSINPPSPPTNEKILAFNIDGASPPAPSPILHETDSFPRAPPRHLDTVASPPAPPSIAEINKFKAETPSLPDDRTSPLPSSRSSKSKISSKNPSSMTENSSSRSPSSIEQKTSLVPPPSSLRNTKPPIIPSKPSQNEASSEVSTSKFNTREEEQNSKFSSSLGREVPISLIEASSTFVLRYPGDPHMERSLLDNPRD